MTENYDLYYREGYRHAEQGLDLYNNPYPLGSEEAKAWAQGWEDGDYEAGPEDDSLDME